MPSMECESLSTTNRYLSYTKQSGPWKDVCKLVFLVALHNLKGSIHTFTGNWNNLSHMIKQLFYLWPEVGPYLLLHYTAQDDEYSVLCKNMKKPLKSGQEISLSKKSKCIHAQYRLVRVWQLNSPKIFICTEHALTQRCRN